jgi:hypothetical protein
MCIDHDHSTGKVRGYLCNGCNVALAHLKDSVTRMKQLINYIEREEINQPCPHDHHKH